MPGILPGSAVSKLTKYSTSRCCRIYSSIAMVSVSCGCSPPHPIEMTSPAEPLFNEFARRLLVSEDQHDWWSCGSLRRLRSAEGEKFLISAVDFAIAASAQDGGAAPIVTLDYPLEAFAETAGPEPVVWGQFLKWGREWPRSLFAGNLIAAVRTWSARHGDALDYVAETLGSPKAVDDRLFTLSLEVVRFANSEDKVATAVWRKLIRDVDSQRRRSAQLVLLEAIARRRWPKMPVEEGVRVLEKQLLNDVAQRLGRYADLETIFPPWEEPMRRETQRVESAISVAVNRRIEEEYLTPR